MNDLFGNPVIPDGPAMTPAERRKQQRRLRGEEPRGYYAPPGTGPEGEACRTCRHAVCTRMSKNYWKCDIFPGVWAGNYRTDIRLKSPACRGWAPRG